MTTNTKHAKFSTITRPELEQKLRSYQPDNDDRRSGYALVNVLPQDLFAKEHIPSSINIPGDQLERFEERFARDKEIVLYGASPDSDISPETAVRLADRGFTHVVDYEAGMTQWRAAGNSVASGAV